MEYGAHLLHPLPGPLRVRHPDAAHHLGLADIQRRDPRDDLLDRPDLLQHLALLHSTTSEAGRPQELQGQGESNPRARSNSEGPTRSSQRPTNPRPRRTKEPRRQQATGPPFSARKGRPAGAPMTSPLRPIYFERVREVLQGTPCQTLTWPHRDLLRQCRQRIVLCHLQEGTDPHSALADHHRPEGEDKGLGRQLLQRQTPTLLPRILDTHGIRARIQTPQSTGSLIRCPRKRKRSKRMVQAGARAATGFGL